MKNKGFYIKSVIATGEGMITSRVDFKDGCNLLFGPSEMGKSSVFSLIDFMLGKKDAPKLPPEGEGYNTFYMEFVTHEDQKIHTAKRLLKDHVVTVKNCEYEKFDNVASKGSVYKSIPYSQYLMGLNGFEGELQLKKSTTDKAAFTYTWIRHLILADENRIVSETPIFFPQNERITITQEKSVIYYLTTGKDDSDFTVQEKAELRTYRYVGMIELTQENIDNVNRRIRKLGDVSFANSSDAESLKDLQKQLSSNDAKLRQLYTKRDELENDKRKLVSKQLFATEFVKRMEMLQKHYQTDLQRFEFIYEGASLFSLLTETRECPICHSEIKDKVEISEEYQLSVQNEYNRVKAKLKDIGGVIEKKNKELLRLEGQINKIVQDQAGVESEISEFSKQLSDIKQLLHAYQKHIEKRTEAKFLEEESQRLYKKLDELQKEKKNKPAAPEYNRQTDINEEFCNLIKEKLVYWKVLGENETVVFDENGFDFVLGGKARLTCGKGARGVTCAAILMSLLEYCQAKEIPFSNVLVLDSPITAHFSDEKVVAEESTQNRFFQYCNDRINDYQLIIIDNKSPDPQERERLTGINYIEFSKEGRNGFYLGKSK